MFTKLLRRSDVYTLLKDIYNSHSYNNKDNNVASSTNFICQPLFILFEALFKYAIIVDDEKYLDNYIFQLSKLFRKVDNIYDIITGVNRIIGKICASQLKIDDLEDKNNKKKIVEYVYDKYIVNGYVFHGYPSIYKSRIERFGLDPENYENYYSRFIELNKIFASHGVSDLIDKNFSSRLVYFTDSFYMGCYYGANSPNYFYKIFSHDFDNYKDEYLKNDYFGCFSILNRLIKEAKLSNTERKIVLKYCLDEWKILNKNNSSISLLLVKRESLGINYLGNINTIINECIDLDLGELIGKVINSSNDNIRITKKIDSKNIYYLDIPNYKILFDSQNAEMVKAIQRKKQKESVEKLSNAYGKVSILVLIGAIFITLGVIITIVNLWG